MDNEHHDMHDHDHDMHAQTARDLFGEDGPAFRSLAKEINFLRLYGGREKVQGERLFPHQEEVIAQAREMTHWAWPGLALAPDTGKMAAAPALVPAIHHEPEFLDETSIVRGRDGVRGNIEIAIAEHLSKVLQ
jgi:hypothetical protein